MKNKNIILTLVLLTCIAPAIHAFSQEKDGVKIQVKDFINEPYAHVISDTNWIVTAEDLQKQNIGVIKVKVTNNTDKPVCISGRSIKFTQIESKELLTRLKKREILPPFLLSCFSGITGFFTYIKAFINSSEEMVQQAHNAGFSDQDIHDISINPNHIRYNEFKDTIAIPFVDSVQNKLIKIIGITSIGTAIGAFAYWSYLKDLNNQLSILLQKSLLDDLITIAPNQSVDKIILCEGMLKNNFNFIVFNKSYVPMTTFEVTL